MEQIRLAISHMIKVSPGEMEDFLGACFLRKFRRTEILSGFGKRANMIMNMALTPSQVGIPILKALGRRTTVLPGFLTKLLVYSLRTVPRWGKVRIMKIVMTGMTKHQKETSLANV